MQASKNYTTSANKCCSMSLVQKSLTLWVCCMLLCIGFHSMWNRKNERMLVLTSRACIYMYACVSWRLLCSAGFIDHFMQCTLMQMFCMAMEGEGSLRLLIHGTFYALRTAQSHRPINTGQIGSIAVSVPLPVSTPLE